MTIHHNFMQIASCLLNSFENQSITHDSIKITPPKNRAEKKKGDQHVTKIPSPFLTLLGSLLSKKSTYHQDGTYREYRYCDERDTIT